MAVADEAGPQLVGGQLLPDVVVVARQHRRASRCPGACSGRAPGGDGVADARGPIAAVWPRATTTPAATSFSMNGRAPVVFRSERHQPDASAGGVLESDGTRPSRAAGRAAADAPARTVLRDDVRPFQVESRAPPRARSASVSHACRSVREAVEQGFDGRWSPASGSSPPMPCRRQARRRGGCRRPSVRGELKLMPSQPLICRSNRAGATQPASTAVGLSPAGASSRMRPRSQATVDQFAGRIVTGPEMKRVGVHDEDRFSQATPQVRLEAVTECGRCREPSGACPARLAGPTACC